MGKLRGLYVDDDLHRRIKTLAAQEGITIREMVEKLLTDELKNRGENGKNSTEKQSH